METLEELQHLPMTDMEIHLKEYIEKHTEIKGKILTSAELLAFLSQLLQEHNNSLQISDLDIFAGNNPMHTKDFQRFSLMLNSFANRKTTFAGDDPFFDSITDLEPSYTLQKASNYISNDFDIAVFRMFRYMPAHWHINDYFEVYYVFSGVCPLLFENETVEMKPGTVFTLSPTANHASPCYSDDCVLLTYSIRTSTFNTVFWNNLSDQNLMSSFFSRALSGKTGNPYLHFETGDDEAIRSLLYRIYQEYLSEENYRPQMLNALMNEFFILLLRRYENRVLLPVNGTFHWKSNFLDIFSYIQSHYNTVTLEELSQKFNYSERQLTRIIQGCTGGSNFTDVLYELRMRKATGLLTGTSLNLEQIADQVGYNNLSSFHRAFTRYLACSPAKYRKKQLH